MTDVNPKKQDKQYSPAESAQRWEKELVSAEKELKKFHDASKRINKKYLDQRDASQDDNADSKINLFWSNIQVLKSSLYARPPRVDVSNSFKDSEDDVSRVAGNILERILNQSVQKEEGDFHVSAFCGISDYLIVGLGQMWYRYEVETEQRQTEAVTDPTTGQVMVPSQPYEAVVREETFADYIFWEDFWWSPARTWAEVRWVARRVFMTREQLKIRFGDKIAKAVPLAKVKKNADSTQPQNDPWEKACVFEIWDKTTKCAYWHVRGMDVILDKKEDPLMLDNFFPCPPPLISNLTTSNVMPRSDYVMAQDQYEQIDELTTRIKWLTRAAKVVGVYDKQSTGIARIFTDGHENQLIPVDNWAAFAEKGGVKGSVDFIPLEDIAATIERLTAQREVISQKLYEVLGIGDIMRGMTNPDETLGAQQLKAQFGGSRLQYKQQEIGNWIAAGQRIHAQIIANFYQPDTIKHCSNIMNSPDAQLADPAIQLLKSGHYNWQYRITVESETMAMVDWAQERDARTQFMTAVGSFVQSITPLIQAQPQAAPVVLQLMKWGLGGFRIGKEIETVLDQAIQSASQEQPTEPNYERDAKVKELEASAMQKRTAAVKNIADAREKNIESGAKEKVLGMPTEQPNNLMPGMAPVQPSPMQGAPLPGQPPEAA